MNTNFNPVLYLEISLKQWQLEEKDYHLLARKILLRSNAPPPLIIVVSIPNRMSPPKLITVHYIFSTFTNQKYYILSQLLLVFSKYIFLSTWFPFNLLSSSHSQFHLELFLYLSSTQPKKRPNPNASSQVVELQKPKQRSPPRQTHRLLSRRPRWPRLNRCECPPSSAARHCWILAWWRVAAVWPRRRLKTTPGSSIQSSNR